MNTHQAIRVCCLLFLLLPAGAIAQTLQIINKPIIFDEERKQLSLEYLKQRHGITQSEPTIKPRVIVLHWTAIADVERTFNAFNKSTLPAGRENLAGVSRLNVSSQFVVDRDGTIYQLLPDTVFARHVIGLNYCAIGVENIGSDNDPLTDAQLDADEKLIRYLKQKYNIEYVIGHYEYKKFIGSPLWKETDSSYLTEKNDPGLSFMKRIRERIKDLDIKGTP